MDRQPEASPGAADWLVGGGEMGELVRSTDWSATPLGPRASWPQCLRVAAGICLGNRFPMMIWWGPDLTFLYNDAYAPMLGKRHPGALGRSGREVWAEIWPQLDAQVEAVMRRGETTWNVQVHLLTERNGFPEDTWFTWSYSPIRDEGGAIVGLFNTCQEDTARVLAERDLDRLAEQQQRQRADEQAREGISIYFRDVTEGKRAEAALRESEARFRQLADAMPQIVWAAGPDGTLNYYNRRWFEYIDLDPGAGEEARWDRYIHPDDLPVAYETWAESLRSGEPYSVEFRVRRADGAYRWFLARALAVRGAGGEVARWFGTCTDIDDHKQSEAALRHSREQMEIVVKGANVGVWYCALPFDDLVWDETVKEHFHLPPDARVTIDTFYERIHPDDRERTRRAIDASIGRRRPYDIDYRTVSPDGQSVKWVRASGRGFYDAAGNPTRFDGITLDVTDRVLAEQRVSQLYAVAAALSEAVTPEDVARVAVHQGVAAVGATAGSLALLAEGGSHLEMAGSVGYPAEVIGRWQRFPLDAPIPLAEAVRRGEPVYTESPEERLARYPALAPVNALRATRASACLPLTTGGRAVGVLGLSFERPGDFSADDREFMLSLGRQCAQALERARLFEAERRARAEAERASRMKDEFLATLSHELRTPLNAILGWSQILARGGKDDQDLAEGLAAIERNARAQTRIIEDLLDLSRIISGKVRLDVQRVDLTPVVQAAVQTLKPAADAKGVRLQVVLDPLAGPVSGDPSRLQQVLWNLLNNAVKFTPRGGRVQVLLERVNSHLELSVIDTGEGISADFLPHVFDRFRQADATTTRRHGGFGIGLAIVKQLVELHGGAIRVKSPGEGRGATFTVSLPVTVVHGEPEASPRRRHPGGAGDAVEADACADIAGLRVLVVDDEPDARALVRRLLENCNAVVTVAASAEEALQRVQAERPDVIASDIGMPGEDGYALIRRVRALGPEKGGDTPAVALTAYARAEDRVKAVRAGFQHHVAKPVEPAELIAMIASLGKRRG